MAGRKDKHTVEYFPHYCSGKKTVFILERKYGNDGYAVWFKTLEVLGASERHYFDCRETDQWEYFAAKMNVEESRCKEIIDTLAKLDTISKKLWEKGIIFSENFVKNIAYVYEKRKSDPIISEEILLREFGFSENGSDEKLISGSEIEFPGNKSEEIDISVIENTGREEKRSEGNRREVKGSKNKSLTAFVKMEIENLETEYSELAKSLVGKNPKEIWQEMTSFINSKNPNFIQPYADMWNLMAGYTGLAKVEVINSSRTKKLGARIREPAFDFPAILNKVKDSRILKGVDNGNGWKATFDWIIENETNYVKILEGQYNR